MRLSDGSSEMQISNVGVWASFYFSVFIYTFYFIMLDGKEREFFLENKTIISEFL